MSAGSDREPTTEPVEVVQQMRTATERLRDQAWMLAPLTSAVVHSEPRRPERAGVPKSHPASADKPTEPSRSWPRPSTARARTSEQGA